MSKKDLNTVKIAGLSLISTSEKRLLEFLTSRIVRGRKTWIVTPNSEFLVFAKHNPWFKKILNQADVAIPDGVGLVWASRFLVPRWVSSAKQERVASRSSVIKEQISGIDLMEKLCQEAARHGWSVYLLGGKPKVAEKALAVLKKRHSGLKGWAEAGPKLEIRNTSDGVRLSLRSHDSSEVKEQEAKEVTSANKSRVADETIYPNEMRAGMTSIRRINSERPDILFVAFGMGKQEKFIWDNWSKLDIKLAMGVGGAFDYISGQVPRAPKWVRKIGLEWLFRLVREPWRWKRQLRLIEFIWLIFKEKIQV